MTLVKGHSDFKVKCLTFGLYTQESDSGPLGPLVLIYIADFSSRYESTDTWDIDFVSSHNSDINFTCVVTFLVGPVETPVHGVKTCSTC